ncbi:MAG: WYL domain-containing protein [Actinobacteria bacterium]|nr:WYL domain-containing protein [Actinomycetota bacterium]
MARREAPYERMLRLAAYVAAHSDGRTRADIARDVPGYGGLGTDALEKQLQRDRNVLAKQLGIDIEWSDEHQHYAIRPPYFTAKERSALIAAAGSVDVEGIDEDRPPAELGAAVDQDAARIVVRVHGHVVELRDAIAERRSVQLHYHGRDRTVDPYALGMWRNRWYLVGHEHRTDGLRKYRLDRIEPSDDGAAITPVGASDAFAIPDGFDAAHEMRMDPNVWGRDPELRARVRVAREQLPPFVAELGGRVVGTDDDSATVELTVRDYMSFVIRVLGFGTGARVVAPPELVARERDWLAPQAEAR